MASRPTYSKLSKVDWEVILGFANRSEEEALAALSKVQAASDMGREVEHNPGVKEELDPRTAEMSWDGFQAQVQEGW